MTHKTNVDWQNIDMVVFDVDGTLYDQNKLRFLMAKDLMLSALVGFDLTNLRVLKVFRSLRERLAEEEVENFEPILVQRTAAAVGIPGEQVMSIVHQWILQRPLRYLARCRYPAIDRLFAGLRRDGKTIGILSDYPAHDKLKTLGLFADYVVAAGDVGVGRLKPHPRGLEALMEAAGVKPERVLFIGDRNERDGKAACRAGAQQLIRTKRVNSVKFPAFEHFDDAIFAPVLS